MPESHPLGAFVFGNKVFAEVIKSISDEIILDLGLGSLKEKGEGDLRHRVMGERSCDNSHNDGGRDWCPAAPTEGMPLASRS